jgi:hypothetical protein
MNSRIEVLRLLPWSLHRFGVAAAPTYIVCLAIFLAGPSPSFAAENIRSHELIAIQVRVLQSDLMIAALNCDLRDQYNQIVRLNDKELVTQGRNLKNLFSRRYGAAGERELNRFVTAIANDSSSRAVALGSDYCVAAQQLMTRVLAAPANGITQASYEIVDLAGIEAVTALAGQQMAALAPAQKPQATQTESETSEEAKTELAAASTPAKPQEQTQAKEVAGADMKAPQNLEPVPNVEVTAQRREIPVTVTPAAVIAEPETGSRLKVVLLALLVVVVATLSALGYFLWRGELPRRIRATRPGSKLDGALSSLRRYLLRQKSAFVDKIRRISDRYSLDR